MYLFAKKDGSLSIFRNQTLIAAATRSAAEQAVKHVSQLQGEPVSIIEADDTHYLGLTFLKGRKSAGFYGPVKDVWFAFKRRLAAEEFIERNKDLDNLRLRAIAASW